MIRSVKVKKVDMRQVDAFLKAVMNGYRVIIRSRCLTASRLTGKFRVEEEITTIEREHK